mgnify:CR=1 FL=1
MRPARKFAKGETVIRIDGDWEHRPPTDSDKGCIYWREEFSRSSLGRISQRFWLRGRFTRDLWPHVRAVDIKTAATLVVVLDAKGQGLRLDAAMDLEPWSCELTVAVKIGRIGRDVRSPATPQSIAGTPTFASPGTPAFAADVLSPQALTGQKAEETSTSFGEHLRKADDDDAAFGVEDADDEDARARGHL